MDKNKPILCLDFDGVCHSYTSGWQGADVIPDPPVPGLWHFLVQANTRFELHIFSSRSIGKSGVEAMMAWFERHAPFRKPLLTCIDRMTWENEVCLVFPTNKPPAMVTLDDRAITFTGTWPSVHELTLFQPWHMKAPI